MATKTRRTGEVIRLAYISNDYLVKLDSYARTALASCSGGELELHTGDILPLRSFVGSVEAVRSTYADTGPAIDTLGVNLVPDYGDRKYVPPRAWPVLSRKPSPKERGVLALADLASGAELAVDNFADILRVFVNKFLTSSDFFDIHKQPRELLDLYTLLREMHMGAEEILRDLVNERLQFFKTQLNKLDRTVSSVCDVPLECTANLKVDTASDTASSAPPPSPPARTTRQVRKTRNRRAARKTEVAAVESNDQLFKEAVRVHEQEMARCGLNLIAAPPAPTSARRRRCRRGVKPQTAAHESTEVRSKEMQAGVAELVASNVECEGLADKAPESETPTPAEAAAEPHGSTRHARRRRRRVGKKQTPAKESMEESMEGGAGKSASSDAEVGPRAPIEAKVGEGSEGSSAEGATDAAVDAGTEVARGRRRKARKSSGAAAAKTAEGTQGDAAPPDATCPKPTAETLDVGVRSDGGATTDPASSFSSDAEGACGKVAEKRRRTSRLRRNLRCARRRGRRAGGTIPTTMLLQRDGRSHAVSAGCHKQLHLTLGGATIDTERRYMWHGEAL